MLSKGTELFIFEGQFFKFKQKYINRDMTDADWQELLIDGDQLIKPYTKINKTIELYVVESVKGFCEFLGKKEKDV